MPYKPLEPNAWPTLGWGVLDWMTENLASPAGGRMKSMFDPYPEQAAFILRFYRLDPDTGRRVYRRAGLCRPRGWGKSPTLGALVAAETFADVVFDGWDADGQPVGRPWSDSRNVLSLIAAVSEDQARRNTWSPLLEMVRNGPIIDNYDVEAFDTKIIFPYGAIEMLTASADTVIGAPPVICAADQTESWVKSNGGHKLWTVVMDNAAKTDGVLVESPNAFVPGAESVAEKSFAYARKIAEGKAVDRGLLWDDKEAPDVELSDRPALIEALRHVYGDSAKTTHPDGTVTGHVNIERLADEVNDPGRSEDEYRRMFLNRKLSTGDAFTQAYAWQACGPHPDDPLFPDWVAPKPVSKTDAVVLGFDGSRKRKRGVTDATALVACRVSDGFVWTVHVWEEPDGPESVDWEVPEVEVEAVLDEFMENHRVVGFKADVSLWEANVARWEQKYGPRLKVGSKAHPIAFHTGLKKMETSRAVVAVRTAINTRELKHNNPAVLTRHVLNAIVHEKTFGPLLYKRTPSSSDKIDAAYALVLAWMARIEALATDLADEPEAASFIPARIY